MKLNGSGLRKVQPKLRMVANGNTEVNVLRAEYAAAVAVSREQAGAAPRARVAEMVSADAAPRVRRRRLAKRADAFVSVFVGFGGTELNAQLSPGSSLPLTAAKAGLATAELPVEQALALADSDEVNYIELGQPLTLPTPTIETGSGHSIARSLAGTMPRSAASVTAWVLSRSWRFSSALPGLSKDFAVAPRKSGRWR